MSSSDPKSALDALHALLRPDEEILDTVRASPAQHDTTVMFRSVLAITNQRVLEVSTPTFTKLGIGKPSASSVSVALGEITGCDFRRGKLYWKNGGNNLVVVQSSNGQYAWATSSTTAGSAFAEKVVWAAEASRNRPIPAPAPAALSDADELLKLAGLRDRGVITDAEFAAKKAQILGLDSAVDHADAEARRPARARPQPRPAALIQVGTHSIGPAHGSLKIRVEPEGRAASAGGSLIMEVTEWSANLAISENSSAELTADPSSIRVLECIGCPKPLRDRDRRKVEGDMAQKVLGTSQISFQSTDVQLADNQLTISGELTIAGTTGHVRTQLAVAADGNVSGRIKISQRNHGIKQFSALMGSLKVRDDVTILIEARVPRS